MKAYERQLYAFLLMVHPGDFRREFGREMTRDLQDIHGTYGSVAIFWDAMVSVARQWAAYILPRAASRRTPGKSCLLAGHYCLVEQGGLTPFELVRGLTLFLVLFGAFCTAATPAKSETPNFSYASASAGGEVGASIHAPAATNTIVIGDVTIVDVEHGTLQAHKSVLITGGRISSIDSARAARPMAGVDFIDGHGKFLIPALWDMHTHITHTDIDMPLYIANGVLGLRNMGGVQDEVFKWQKELQDGTLFGPRTFVSGPILDGPTGPVQPASYGVRIANAAEARAEVDTLKIKGADFVKVYDGLSRESYFAIAEEAKKDGLPFAGHVPSDITILEATNAGQRSIEHGIEHRGESTAEQEIIEAGKKQDFMAEAMRTKNYTLIPDGIARAGNVFLSTISQKRAEALYRKLAKNGTYLCPTLGVQYWVAFGDEMALKHDPREKYVVPATLVYWQPSMNMLTRYRTPAYITFVKRRYAASMKQVAKEQAAGVQLLAGTDLTVPYIYAGFSLHDEMKFFVTAGLTPLQTLQTAVTHPVEFFSLQQTMGSVTVGKLAEVVLLDGNPLKDIGNVDRIAAVITHGKLLRRPELDAMLASAARAAQNAK